VARSLKKKQTAGKSSRRRRSLKKTVDPSSNDQESMMNFLYGFLMLPGHYYPVDKTRQK
jgi:hypothetical protein